MANIWKDGKFYPFDTDMRQLILTKIRTEHTCKTCGELIPKGSYCVGITRSWYSYGKCCLKCAEKFLNKFIESIDEFKKIGQDTLKDIKKNRKKYEQNNTLARI